MDIFDRHQMAARLAEARTASHMTQQYVADCVGVEKATVSHWENGRHAPPYEMLTKLVGIYGRSLNWIISGQEFGDAMSKEAYELARITDDLPPALREFIALTVAMADAARESFPDRVIATPTPENWLDFARALHAASQRK